MAMPAKTDQKKFTPRLNIGAKPEPTPPAKGRLIKQHSPEDIHNRRQNQNLDPSAVQVGTPIEIIQQHKRPERAEVKEARRLLNLDAPVSVPARQQQPAPAPKPKKAIKKPVKAEARRGKHIKRINADLDPPVPFKRGKGKLLAVLFQRWYQRYGTYDLCAEKAGVSGCYFWAAYQYHVYGRRGRPAAPAGPKLLMGMGLAKEYEFFAIGEE